MKKDKINKKNGSRPPNLYYSKHSKFSCPQHKLLFKAGQTLHKTSTGTHFEHRDPWADGDEEVGEHVLGIGGLEAVGGTQVLVVREGLVRYIPKKINKFVKEKKGMRHK